MTVVRQNSLSTIMLKNVKLSHVNIRFDLATKINMLGQKLCSYLVTAAKIKLFKFNFKTPIKGSNYY